MPQCKCSFLVRTSTRIRSSVPTASRSRGCSGITRTCRGTAPSCGRPRSRPMARWARERRSRAALTSRSSSPNGRPTACCTSSRIAPAGGISIAAVRLRQALRRGGHVIEPLHPMSAEFGKPQWAFSMVTYAFASPTRIVATYSEGGRWKMALIESEERRFEPVVAESRAVAVDSRQRARRLFRRRLANRGSRRRRDDDRRDGDGGPALVVQRARSRRSGFRCRKR